jgi:hypothetical protein
MTAPWRRLWHAVCGLFSPQVRNATPEALRLRSELADARSLAEERLAELLQARAEIAQKAEEIKVNEIAIRGQALIIESYESRWKTVISVEAMKAAGVDAVLRHAG